MHLRERHEDLLLKVNLSGGCAVWHEPSNVLGIGRCLFERRLGANRSASRADLCPDTLVRENFQQGCVGHSAVDDMGAGYAALHGFKCTVNLGQHAALNDPLLNQLLDLTRIEPGQSVALRVQ